MEAEREGRKREDGRRKKQQDGKTVVEDGRGQDKGRVQALAERKGTVNLR
jgi:hypothetical protein